MTLEDAHNQIGNSVAYIPLHACGDINHPDVEYGKISSYNDRFIFVKFDKQLANLGWEETTAQSCLPESLALV